MLNVPGVPPAITQSDIDNRIRIWHTTDDSDLSLREYLGWTWEQYSLWVEEGIKPYEE